MLTIAAIRPALSYAPELLGLRTYLGRHRSIRVDILSEADFASSASKYDLSYRLMGFLPRWSPAPTPEIHDYASLSSGTFRAVKDHLKVALNRPALIRSFLNDYVRARLPFHDTVPYVLRDMGVDECFFHVKPAKAEYMFCYAGSITRSRQIHRLLAHLTSIGGSVLVVGDPDRAIYERFRTTPEVRFTGRLDREDVAACMARCEYGVSFVPDVEPFHGQTATKILEYCAVGLKVVTNAYSWVDTFEDTASARFFKFRSWDEVSIPALQAAAYRVPDMRRYAWDAIFERSGIGTEIDRLTG